MHNPRPFVGTKSLTHSLHPFLKTFKDFESKQQPQADQEAPEHLSAFLMVIVLLGNARGVDIPLAMRPGIDAIPIFWGECRLASCRNRGGDRLKACSRCDTVQYCSSEHQIENWEKHQLICKKPKW